MWHAYLKGMSTPLIVTQLLLKRAEIEAQIKSLEDRLGQARADLLHVAATVRLFNPTAIDRPTTVYHGATKAMRRWTCSRYARRPWRPLWSPWTPASSPGTSSRPRAGT